MFPRSIQFSSMLVQQFEDVSPSADRLIIKGGDDIANSTIQHGANSSLFCWAVGNDRENDNTRDLQSIGNTIWCLGWITDFMLQSQLLKLKYVDIIFSLSFEWTCSLCLLHCLLSSPYMQVAVTA